MKRVLGIVVIVLFLATLAETARSGEPELSWSIFLAQEGAEGGLDIVVQSCGNNAFVTGHTRSYDFPTTEGAFDVSFNGTHWGEYTDVFVSKLSTAGDALSYSTFLGGDRDEWGHGIAVDDSGNAYVTGETRSNDFPVTQNAFDTTLSGGNSDAFVVKLNSTGSQAVYSTFLGGSGSDKAHGIALDDAGNAYVTGATSSKDFPTTPNAFDTTSNGGDNDHDIFVSKLNAAGTNLIYSTFLGGNSTDSGADIDVTGSGEACLTGHSYSNDFPTTTGACDTTYNGSTDVIVARFNAAGDSLGYATYLGGESRDYGHSIALDKFSQAHVTGYTISADFPTTVAAFDKTYNGLEDAFVAKLSPQGNSLEFSTFLGGAHGDWGNGIAVDNAGYCYVTGTTDTRDFPTTPDAFDTSFSGSWDAFVAKLFPAGTALSYSTYLGGNGVDFSNAIDVDAYGKAYVTGETASYNFPITSGAYDSDLDGYFDAFVIKLNAEGDALTYSTYLGGSYNVPVQPENTLANTPFDYKILQNHPNPFNASTEIRYQIPRAEQVSLRIYNITGQVIRTLSDSYQEAGSHAITWDGRDDTGQDVSSGVYFCRLQAGDFAKTIKMVLVK